MCPIENEDLPLDIGGVDFAEHSKMSRAKKVVPGPLFMPDNAGRTIQPINSAAASGQLTIERNKGYRLVSDGDLNIFLSTEDAIGTPTSADMYLPAKTPLMIAARSYTKLNFLRTGGSFIQLTEVK